jgi:hypothetical protein
MAEQVQFIVSSLNQAPFKKGLSLVSFDKKSTFELLQLVQDVIEEISPEQKSPIPFETSEDLAQHIFDFLWILKYKAAVQEDP